MPMTMIRNHARPGFVLLGLPIVLAVFLSVSLIRAEEPPIKPVILDAVERVGGPQHPASAKVVTRVLSDGRIEVCLLTDRLQVLCPRLRTFHPDRVRKDRWISSSEVSWQVPLDMDAVVLPPALPPAGEVEGRPEVERVEEEQVEIVKEAVCQPDFDRMMAATWKVNTTKWQGSAFHIGNGLFITAHHVIDGVPPFATLTHGDRAIAVSVLGSDPEVDMALLGVMDGQAIEELAEVALKIPTTEHIGKDVFLVGYPGGGPLTVSFGGIVSRVWEDEILTTSAGGGGNSGGPMFDACGDVVGVLWAGGSVGSFSHSGETLIEKLEELEPAWPPLPTNLPDGVAVPDGLLVWHYGTEPPAEVNCSRANADIWIGVAGDTPRLLSQFTHGLYYLESCSYGYTRVLGYEKRPPPPEDPPEDPAEEATEGNRDSTSEWTATCHAGSIVEDEHIASVVHRSMDDFGALLITTMDLTTDCPIVFNYRVQIDFDPPLERPWGASVDLIDINGARLDGPWQGGYYKTGGNGPDSPTTSQSQAWELPDDFVPAKVVVGIGNRGSSTIDIVLTEPEGPTFSQSLRIAALVDSRSQSVHICLRSGDGPRHCPERNEISLASEVSGEWQVLGRVEWLAEIRSSLLAGEDEEEVESTPVPISRHCALNEDVGQTSWQVSSVSDTGTAVYVGRGQFLVESSIVSAELPWAVVSRGEQSVPTIRVAEDARNGLALLEVMGEHSVSMLEPPIRLGRVSEAQESAPAWLVGYPWGDSKRFTVALGEVTEVTERTFRFPTWGAWYRSGAPVLDPCTYEALGISLGGGSILRAETVSESLQRLRHERQAPSLPETGPPFHGTAALWPYPVYVGTEQPNFGGWICNVRESERHDIYYAIYLANSDSYQLGQVVDGKDDWVRTCGWSGKIFIVEYRSDRVPELLCAAPDRPSHPSSDMAVDFTAPEGVELLQIATFHREPCSEVEYEHPWQDDWTSDLYLSIRVTSDFDLDQIHVDYRDAAGEALNTYSSRFGDVDPDVISWRVNIINDQPVAAVAVRLLVED